MIVTRALDDYAKSIRWKSLGVMVVLHTMDTIPSGHALLLSLFSLSPALMCVGSVNNQ